MQQRAGGSTIATAPVAYCDCWNEQIGKYWFLRLPQCNDNSDINAVVRIGYIFVGLDPLYPLSVAATAAAGNRSLAILSLPAITWYAAEMAAASAAD
jgi:hypothetical protein